MRVQWVTYLEKIAFPVIHAAAHDNLKKTMPVYKNRSAFQYLEAVGRLVCGIAPWLNLPNGPSKEGNLRSNYSQLTVKAIGNLVNPKSKDYVDFGTGAQALVDAAYLSQGLLRAPNLWRALGNEIQKKLLFEIKKTRKFQPPKNNWLLFASMIEAFLLTYDNNCNKKRLHYGVKKFVNSYYIGDGLYGDGAHFSMDHYNSFVIHPMLMDVLEVMKIHGLKNFNQHLTKQLPRYQRYIEIQERMISPEGAYPLFGRTLICRFGAFHALSQAALMGFLPKHITPSQVRCSLNAVLKRQMETPDNFDAQGFLTVGFNGKQEKMAEQYVSSGSAYHCATLFLPLGLDSQHPFWTEKDAAWTSLKAFDGHEFEPDKSYYETHITKDFFMSILYKFQSGWRKIKNLFKGQ
ncbi:DUF2264 domain-containing protein [Litoribaculum gwangyangense]|uniref:DUF2264 domain-containing protein n=1 Tax=Litoribaculum gwangyangense TaxID=1130722 RepID=A0ABP9CUF9_9FLAO